MRYILKRNSILLYRYFIPIIINMLFFMLSLNIGYGMCEKKTNCTIPYKAEGEHENLYKDLVEVKSFNEEINSIVDYAKKIAKEAGYAISGDELDIYLLKNQAYPIQIKVYENKEYYLILFSPMNTPVTSQNLEITIHKETKNIITILKGS